MPSPRGGAGGHSPSGALLWPPPVRHPLRGTWAAQLGGRFWLRGERSRQSTPTGHRPRGGDMSAGGRRHAGLAVGVCGESAVDPGIEARAALWWPAAGLGSHARVRARWDHSAHASHAIASGPQPCPPRCPAPAHACGPGGPSGPGREGDAGARPPLGAGEDGSCLGSPVAGGLGDRARGRPAGWGREQRARRPPRGGSGLSGEFMPVSGLKVSGLDARRWGSREVGTEARGRGTLREPRFPHSPPHVVTAAHV